jgi:hypothetical protein
MANTQTAQAKGIVPSPAAMGQEVVQLRAEISPVTFGTADIIEMVRVPVGMKVLDWTVDTDDLDSGSNLVFKVGVLNAGKTDLDTGNAVWKTGLTTGQAGGIARMDTVTALRAGTATAERVVAIIPTTAAAGYTTGVVGITVYMAAA